MFLKWLQNIQTKRFFNTVQGTGPCLGVARPSQTFDCFWKASRHPDEKLTQHRELSWTVFGEARPAVHLNAVESLHNIKKKTLFNAVKWAGPWQGMLGSAAQPSTWMFLSRLHNTQTKRFFNLVKKVDRVWGSTTSRSFERCWKSA